MPQAGNQHDPDRSGNRFLRQIFAFYAVGALFAATACIFWFASDALLLLFASILFAILLDRASRILQRRLHLPRWLALAAVIFLLLLLLGGGGWLLAPSVTRQSRELMTTVPQALHQLRTTLEHYDLLRAALDQAPATPQLMSKLGVLAPKAGTFFSGALGVVGNAVIIFFVGAYFAAQPHLYIDGLILLVPHRGRQHARKVLEEIGDALAGWLAGKLVQMLVAGVAVTAGLLLLGVPLAVVLGIIAGLLDFIPYLGPIAASLPAILIGFAQSPTLGLYVTLLFVGIHVLDGYVVLPLVEKRTVSLPPALTIFMQVLLGFLFGFGGVALASPLAAVALVLVTMLYVRDTLGDAVRTPAEK